tara:strand:- start:326 stop:1054 length:729 start_codon:yes stop_codon:yes gene_type:complete
VKKYSVVLPCLNEARNLPELVDRFRTFEDKWDFELIIVDNGSTDDTASVLESIAGDKRNHFIKPHKIIKNRGYGHGIRSGLDVASGNILAFTHADKQTPPEDVFRAFELYRSGQIDPGKTIVKGRRPGRGKELLTTRGLSALTRLITGLQVEDINGQPKVFHRSLLGKMRHQVDNFAFDPYVLYIASKQGFSIQSMEVKFESRQHGISKSAGTIVRKYRTILGFIMGIIKFSLANKIYQERR